MPPGMAGMAHGIADEYDELSQFSREQLELDIINAMKEAAREVALFFAAHPDKAKEIPVPENMPLRPVRFWQEVYIAAIRAGCDASEAKALAQQALTDMQKLGEAK
jgi:hypothetical protein